MAITKIFTNISDSKLAGLVMEFREYGCTVTREKQAVGDWTVRVSFSEDKIE